jgi:20S proteasome alpha/beta subunit
MTVCIGALCSNNGTLDSGAVVVAADRMVTMGNLVEFEHEIPKAIEVTSRCVALIAGDALGGAQVARDAASHFATNPGAQIAEIVGFLASQYSIRRDERIEHMFFRPRGITKDEFYRGGLQRRMIQPLTGQIDNHVASYDYGVEMLVAGADGDRAHLYAITNPGGISTDFRQIGFGAIGSGALHAVQALIGLGHNGTKSINEAVFSVYAAKRRSEVAPGVGLDTDLLLIDSEGTSRLSPAQLGVLQDLFKEYERPFSQELRGHINGLESFAQREEDPYASSE